MKKKRETQNDSLECQYIYSNSLGSGFFNTKAVLPEQSTSDKGEPLNMKETTRTVDPQPQKSSRTDNAKSGIMHKS